MGTAAPIFRLRNLLKRRGAGYRLRIPELDVAAGSRILLTGDSGSGKSTALDLLALALKPDGADEFRWRLGGRDWDLRELWRRGRTGRLARLRGAGLGYVLQTGGLLPFLTVRENILLPARLNKMDSRQSRRRLGELLGALRLERLAGEFPSRISVGERQRCAIARAVIHEPGLILADEPTASLDPPTADLVFDLLLDLSRSAALVVATHDLSRGGRHDFQVHRVACQIRPEEGGLIEAFLRPTGESGDF